LLIITILFHNFIVIIPLLQDYYFFLSCLSISPTSDEAKPILECMECIRYSNNMGITDAERRSSKAFFKADGGFLWESCFLKVKSGYESSL